MFSPRLSSFVALFSILASRSALVSVEAQAVCARQYTVRLGDTCDLISAAHNSSTFQLALVNPIINAECSNLALGMPLCLGNVGADCTTTHTIVDGDFCFSIFTDAGIPFSTLLANNPNVDSGCSNIYVGEVLCTASEIFDYNTTSTTK